MKGFVTGVLFCIAFMSARSQEMTYTVLFEYDKYDIPDTSLVNLIRIIKNQNVDRVLLEGHCDNIGSKEYNYALSDNRALSVKKLLIENGISPKNIKQCIGFGKDRPLTPNETPEERQVNRRVVTTFYLKDDQPRFLKETTPKVTRGNETSKADVVKQERESWDFLKIEPTKIQSGTVNIDSRRRDKVNDEPSGLKPVIIKTEAEIKDYLNVDAIKLQSAILKKEIGNKDSIASETSAVRPVIIKSEPEIKDFLTVGTTITKSGIVNNETPKTDALFAETSAVKPVIIKSEPERKDFLSVGATSIKSVAVHNDSLKKDAAVKPVINARAKKESLRVEVRSAQPVIVKDEVAKKEYLNVETTGVKTEIANIGDANIGDQIVLENILFEPGRHFLKPESMEDLENLLSALKEYPNLEIEIQGHVCCTTTETDGYDWDEETNNLSETRARQIYFFLIKNGISPERLKFKGYGGTRKINRDESTEELRRVNRRVEVKILNK